MGALYRGCWGRGKRVEKLVSVVVRPGPFPRESPVRCRCPSLAPPSRAWPFHARSWVLRGGTVDAHPRNGRRRRSRSVLDGSEYGFRGLVKASENNFGGCRALYICCTWSHSSRVPLAMSRERGKGVFDARSGANRREAFDRPTSSKAPKVVVAKAKIAFRGVGGKS